MSSLAELLRPKDFDSMVGNAGIIESVKEILKKKQFPKSWIFSGPSGIGKTTIARIIAKKVGARGEGIKEINTADIRGIDGIREIIEISRYKSFNSKTSVYILDECHQLTKDAQNALLKSLENPPDHVYFILCTTDSSKLLNTIKTRCIEFVFREISQDDIIKLLSNVMEAANINVTDYALEQIIKNCYGSPRMAINLIEKCNNIGDNTEIDRLVSGTVLDDEGVSENDFILATELYKYIKDGKWKSVGSFLDKKLFNKAVSKEGVMMGLKNKYGKALRSTGNGRFADAILILEDMNQVYTNAGYSALIYKVYKVFN